MNDKVKAFFKEKGFYISLLVGVIAILLVGIISANVLTDKNEIAPKVAENEPEASLAEESKPDITVAKQETEEIKQFESKPVKDETVEKVDTIKQAKKSEVAEEKEPVIAPVISQSERVTNLTFDEEKGLLWPISGDILLGYSMDQSVYFKTLAQYKCNPALLIAGTQDMDVLCAYNGVITSIAENEETGTTLTMSIGNGYQIIYGNLNDVTWKEGDYVSEGTSLGVLAAPTKYYVEEGCNLYFEVIQDDENVDPLLVLR
ncbi:MAG: peptidoglycan DD-metalloendopeptidase family protein [Velocimicrobium sp.]